MLMAVCDAHMKADSSVFATMVAGMLLIEKLLTETFADFMCPGCQWGLFLLAQSAKTETLCPRLEKSMICTPFCCFLRVDAMYRYRQGLEMTLMTASQIRLHQK